MRALPLLLVALLATPVPVAQAQPAPQPEPFNIGFTSNDDIFKVDSTGNTRTNLTNNARLQRDPAFSLDGTKLAYVDDRHVMIANADGTNARRLNTEELRQSQPAWSPDGTMIALVTSIPNGDGSDSVVEIYRVSDGVRLGEIEVPEHLIADDTQPDWSPDGKTIAIRRSSSNITLPPPPLQPDTDRPARQGSTFDLEQVVKTPRIPPKPDVVILIDISGSMSGELDSVKRTLTDVIAEVAKLQPETQFGIASYAGWQNAGRTFTRHVQLTDTVGNWQKDVNVIRNEESTEVWAHALIKTATGEFDFRPDSSRVVVVIGDEGTAENVTPPDKTDTVQGAIDALNAKNIRFVGIDSGGLNQFGQARKFVDATDGSLQTFDEHKPGEISTAVLDGIKDLDVKVAPRATCDPGLSVVLTPPGPVTGPSGQDVKFAERFTVAPNATPGSTLKCTIEFLLNNETEPRPGHVQTVTVRVSDLVKPLVRVDDVTAVATPNDSGATVTYQATATGSQGQPLTPTCTPQSGTKFPIGFTTVTCTATDAQGNTGTDTAIITVRSEEEPEGPEVWLVAADNSAQVNLSRRLAEPCRDSFSQDPAWSPDGKSLAITQDERICVVNPDGTGGRVVVQSGANIGSPRSPAWLPDGTRIVFQASNSELPADLWTVPVVNGTPQILTRNGGQPAVQRLPRLAVTTTATPAEVPFNGKTTIEVAVTNSGFAPAPATVTVTVPPGLEGGPASADLGTIAPGERKAVTGEATGVTAGEHVVTAAVGALTSQVTVKVLERTGSLSLKVSASPQPSFVGGDEVAVTFNLLNSSGSTLTDVRVVGSAFGCLPECPVGTLGPDGEAEVRFTIPATQAVDQELVGVVIGTGPDEDPLDNVAATQIVVKQPTLTLDQLAGPLGGVVSVQGKDFPPGAKVRLTWVIGISETPGEVIATDGTFTTQMLVFHNDTEGIRQAAANQVEGTRFGEVKSGDFLAIPSTVQPSDFVERG